MQFYLNEITLLLHLSYIVQGESWETDVFKEDKSANILTSAKISVKCTTSSFVARWRN